MSIKWVGLQGREQKINQEKHDSGKGMENSI